MRISRRHALASLTFPALCRAAAVPPRPTKSVPLLLGNWADPTILKDGNEYYMTHSSFQRQPGLLIWRSRDLRRWKPVGHAAVNQKGSIWAPELIRHGGRYFLYYPLVDGGKSSNWVTTADSPAGPWSTPEPIGAGNIDPGHIVGEDGKRYIHLSGGRVVEMSPEGTRAATEPKQIYEGWAIPPDWAIECVCLESPKLLKRGGWYHLMSAQGGTAGPSVSHMVISARSRTPVGPWENSPYNPIIRTWSREEPWWSKGHGTLVEGPEGQWYCVLHGFLNGQRTLGRCTLIEPVEWTADGWYRAVARWPRGWEKSVRVDLPLSDDFRGKQLGIQWSFHQLYDPSRFTLTGDSLELQAKGVDAGESQPLCVVPLHPAYELEVEVEAVGEALAGLMLFSSANEYLGLAISQTGVIRRVQKGYRRYPRTAEPSIGGTRAALRIVNDRQDVRFYYRNGASEWKVMQPAAEISAGGVVQAALFASGAGAGRFRGFRYRAIEQS
ncbi:MAG: family 43 glycosylhydrolase [Bryobacter sp.]|jgi:beta-xylosidase|nr:family 43 glycosylhydrolase [Bryobacter sp.]